MRVCSWSGVNVLGGKIWCGKRRSPQGNGSICQIFIFYRFECFCCWRGTNTTVLVLMTDEDDDSNSMSPSLTFLICAVLGMLSSQCFFFLNHHRNRNGRTWAKLQDWNYNLMKNLNTHFKFIAFNKDKDYWVFKWAPNEQWFSPKTDW